MKKIFTLFFALAASVEIMLAVDVRVGDLYYNLNETNKTAEVTYAYDSKTDYTFSSISIPSAITCNNESYRVTSIGDETFYNCSKLASVTIPNSVSSIGKKAFSNCSKLSSVTIPNSVTSIKDGTFSGCSSLASVNIPNSVSSIGNTAFYNCSKLSSVTIPNSVTSIGYGVFSGCSSLASVNIPNGVKEIGYCAFYHCSKLSSVTIPNSVTSIGERAFAGCSSLTSMAIPNNVTSIEGEAFLSCSSMTSVNIPSGITRIRHGTFAGCQSLTSIIIPNSVTFIEASAFNNCVGLKSVTCEAMNPPVVQSDAFINVIKYVPLYVPVESVVLYKGLYYWSSVFDNIRGIGTTPVYEHLYEIGDNQGWEPIEGIGMTKKAENIFEGTFAFSGDADSYFGFITELDLSWVVVNWHRFGPSSNGMVANFGANELHENLGNSNAFKITSGVYKLTVNLNEMKLTVASATGIESIEGENNVVKVLEDGRLYILLPDGTRYDATGKKVE